MHAEYEEEDACMQSMRRRMHAGTVEYEEEDACML